MLQTKTKPKIEEWPIKREQLPKWLAVWTQALEEGGHKQIYGNYVTSEGYCAVGLRRLVFSASIEDLEIPDRYEVELYDELAISLNDDVQLSFPEIAQRLKEKFYLTNREEVNKEKQW